MPDVGHGPTLLHGACCRYAGVAGELDIPVIARFKKFCERRVKEKYDPLPKNTKFHPTTWLAENTTYPAGRKQEMLLLFDISRNILTALDRAVKGFGKSETYIESCDYFSCLPSKFEYKPARAINAREDLFKLFAGPIFHEIEKIVYKDPAFIKHVPVRNRPKYITEMLGKFRGPYLVTDYSTYERWFHPVVMDACEFVLYDHMLQNFPEQASILRDTLTGINHISYRHFTMELDGRRMSGEMCTSLGNGFTNLMLAEFVAYESGQTIIGVVEGDDGLFYCSGPIDESLFAKLGFTIDIKHVPNLLQASFCGMVMSSDQCAFADPYKKILNFGWSHSRLMNGGPKVRLGLLKAKALSLAYELPQCPILAQLAITCLAYCGDVAPRFEVDYWSGHITKEIEQFKAETAELLAVGPTHQARIDFYLIFNISIERQIEIENEIKSWTGGDLTGPGIDSLFEGRFQVCRDYFSRYVNWHSQEISKTTPARAGSRAWGHTGSYSSPKTFLSQ